MNRRFTTGAEHGGTIRRIQRDIGGDILDFSANFNPYPPSVDWTPDPSHIDEYPDDTYAILKETIARTFKRDPEEICVGNGSVELIRAFALAALAPHDRFYVDRPTFGEYAVGAELAGARETTDIRESAVRYLCNPNNPTGRLLPSDEVRARLDDARDTDALLCLDEAFIELAHGGVSAVQCSDPHLFVLRSLTKSFTVPGLRFGYGFGDPVLIERIEVARSPWTVNTFAEQFAIRAFEVYNELEESRRVIARDRDRLLDQLGTLGLSWEPPSANFVLVHIPEPASPLVTRLLTRHGILVRDCTSFGLPTSIRIAVRRHEENLRCVEALEACLP